MSESRLLLILKLIQPLAGALGIISLIIGIIQISTLSAFRIPIILCITGIGLFTFSFIFEILAFAKGRKDSIVAGTFMLLAIIIGMLFLIEPSILLFKIYFIVIMSSFTFWTDYQIRRSNHLDFLRYVNLIPLALFLIALISNLSWSWYWLIIACCIPVNMTIGIIALSNSKLFHQK